MTKGTLLGIVTALALIAAQAGSVLHVAAGHRRCAQHGELIDERDGATAELEDATEQPALSALDDAHRHEHCPLGGAAAGFTFVARYCAVALPPSQVGFAPSWSPSKAQDGLLLSIAPKTSPPYAETSG